MQFGLHVPNYGSFGDIQTTVELAHLAEASGWDGLFIWDHLLPDPNFHHGPVADPWVVLTAMAVATRRIRLGALVTAFPRRHPWQLARTTVTLDHLTQGRLVVGAGIGGDGSREYSAVGQSADPRVHGAMLDEALDIIDQLWTGRPVSYSGTHYTLDNARFLPVPFQSPRIPIWIAGIWPNKRPFRRAAQWDGVFPGGDNRYLTPQDVRELLDYIQSHRTVTTPFAVVIGGQAYKKPAEERSAFLSEYAAAGATWWLESFGPDASLAHVRSIIQDGPPHQPSAQSG